MDKRRIVYPAHGTASAMGYKYRCRIEDRERKTWFGFGKEVTEYRYVIEKHFMSWSDDETGYWNEDKELTVQRANNALDYIENKPKGEYIEN